MLDIHDHNFQQQLCQIKYNAMWTQAVLILKFNLLFKFYVKQIYLLLFLVQVILSKPR